VLQTGSTAVVVNGWTDSPLMRQTTGWCAAWSGWAHWSVACVMDGRLGRPILLSRRTRPCAEGQNNRPEHLSTNWMLPGCAQIGGQMQYEIYPWRSVSVRFLRAVMHDITGGRLWLRLLFWLEERFPRFFAEKGQYPMVIRK
jgi:hypothetical protein